MKNYYIQALDMLIYLLEKNGDNEQWIEWLKKDLYDFEEFNDVHHHIQAFGGMGSFNDLYLSNLDQQELIIFDIMKDLSYQIAFFYKRIHQNLCILEKEVLNDVLYKYKEQSKALSILVLSGMQDGNFLEFYLNGKQYKNIQDIIFYRSSVCMADDMNENKRTYACHVNLPSQAILTIIKEYHFLPEVAGNDVVWVAINASGKEIFSYFTKLEKLFLIAYKESIAEVCEDVYEVNFKYYPSPQSRAHYLFIKYHGNAYEISQAGVLPEYQYSSISQKQEEEWRKQL